MANQTRIYIIRGRSAGVMAKPRLVRASHPAHALRHVADGAYQVAVASGDDVAQAYEAGVRVEDVKHEQSEIPGT